MANGFDEREKQRRALRLAEAQRLGFSPRQPQASPLEASIQQMRPRVSQVDAGGTALDVQAPLPPAQTIGDITGAPPPSQQGSGTEADLESDFKTELATATAGGAIVGGPIGAGIGAGTTILKSVLQARAAKAKQARDADIQGLQTIAKTGESHPAAVGASVEDMIAGIRGSVRGVA